MADVDPKLWLKIDAPGLSPETVDPLLALDVAKAYFELVQEVARAKNKEFEFKGIFVEAGSFKIASSGNERRVLRAADLRSRALLRGRTRPTKAEEQALDRTKAIIARVPPDYYVSTTYGGATHPLVVRERIAWLPPASYVTLRALLVGVGGLTRPTARFSAKYEQNGEPFFVHIESTDVAKRLAQGIYSELEISVHLVRNEEGRITAESKLLEFERVSDEDPLTAWTNWFRENASDWDEVEDIELELGRD